MITAMLKSWAQKRRFAAYNKGFQYAAGILLQNYPGGEVSSIEYLQSNVQTSRDFGTYDEFESGVEDAISLWKERNCGCGSDPECPDTRPAAPATAAGASVTVRKGTVVVESSLAGLPDGEYSLTGRSHEL